MAVGSLAAIPAGMVPGWAVPADPGPPPVGQDQAVPSVQPLIRIPVAMVTRAGWQNAGHSK